MRWKICSMAVAVVLTACGAVWAQSAGGSTPGRTLVVGTKATEPFVLRGADGSWSGISIELWQLIAADLGWEFEYRELEFGELMDATERGELDVAVAAFTVTPEREHVLDFSHPFYTTGLGLAVAMPHRRARGLGLLRGLVSRDFVATVTALSVLLFMVGFVVWLFERRRNREDFGGSALQGIGSGFWWSAVTMTTVGYGDKAPRSVAGRFIALLWMFAGIIMISTFTASITTSLTLNQLQTVVQGPDDLPNVRVGTLRDSAPAVALAERNVSYRGYGDLDAALKALTNEEIDVVVYDAPILLYQVKQSYQGEVVVLPRTFEPQVYAIMLPSGSVLREPINRALLRAVRTPEWQNELQRYLGD